MAEKYGVVPPKFTKAWWSYFWYYYKWYVVGGGLALLCIIVTLAQCATRKEYDMTVTYAGKLVFEEETTLQLENALSQFTEDIDGNGEPAVFFQAMTISGAPGQEQYDYVLQTKLDLEFQNERSFVFLFDKEQLDNMMKRDYVADLYAPVSEWAPELGSDFPTEAGVDGGIYAVDVSNSSFLKGLGINCEGMYAALRLNTWEDEDNRTAYESSIAILQEIVK